MFPPFLLRRTTFLCLFLISFSFIYLIIVFRRAQPTVEFVFAATEEAIFVHVVISARSVFNLIFHYVDGLLQFIYVSAALL
jgi:hypothetical protein